MNNRTRLFDLRKNYTQAGLGKEEAHESPVTQFRLWLDQAIQAGITEPNAMILATNGLDGMTSARTVLLKEFDDRGFVFYTNYNSKKGMQLASNPKAALIFLWADIERQIRIEGITEKIAPHESDEYFASRPRESQLGAWASNQSTMVNSREELNQRYNQLIKEYDGKTIPRPPHWGGYRVTPNLIEFWQGRTGRMHDRIVYTLDGQTRNWKKSRLAP